LQVTVVTEDDDVAFHNWTVNVPNCVDEVFLILKIIPSTVITPGVNVCDATYEVVVLVTAASLFKNDVEFTKFQVESFQLFDIIGMIQLGI